MMDNKELEINGVDNEVKEAIYERVAEVVQDNQNGHKSHTEIDHDLYDSIAKMLN